MSLKKAQTKAFKKYWDPQHFVGFAARAEKTGGHSTHNSHETYDEMLEGPGWICQSD